MIPPVFVPESFDMKVITALNARDMVHTKPDQRFSKHHMHGTETVHYTVVSAHLDRPYTTDTQIQFGMHRRSAHRTHTRGKVLARTDRMDARNIHIQNSVWIPH